MVLTIFSIEDTGYILLDSELKDYLKQRFGPDYGEDYDFQIAVSYTPVFFFLLLLFSRNETDAFQVGSRPLAIRLTRATHTCK